MFVETPPGLETFGQNPTQMYLGAESYLHFQPSRKAHFFPLPGRIGFYEQKEDLVRFLPPRWPRVGESDGIG